MNRGERLSRYVYEDHVRRRKDDNLSMGFAMAYAFVALLLGYPEYEAAVGAFVVVAVSMTALTIRYCFLPTKG